MRRTCAPRLAAYERETIKALRRALKVLMLQEELLLQEPESFNQFWKRLQTLVEKMSYARPRPQTPAVTVCSAELVPNMLFKEIYLCGVIEGDFPKHQISTGLLSNEQIRLWLSFGIDIRNPRQEPGFERALFYSLTERAEKKLCLSLPQFGNKAEETFASSYMDELAEKAALQCQRVAPFAQSLKQVVSVREALSASLWQSGLESAQQFDRSHHIVRRRWRGLEQSVSALIARSEGSSENLFNGYLRDFFESQALSLPVETVWTASKINDYGKCPFRYWATHVLSLKPREEAEAGLNFAVIGQFYHKILELFFSAWVKSRQTIELSELIDVAFADGITWIESRSDFQPGPYWPQEKKDLRFRTNRFIERELQRLDDGGAAGFTPGLFEVNFGGKAVDSFPPLVLRNDQGKSIVLRGSIDRVDFSADGSEARVVDYKSGSKPISIKEAEKGRNLQLPIYALALEQCIKPGTTVTDADYLSISVARSVGRMDFLSEKHSHLKALAEHFVKEYTEAVSNGVFTVKPNGKDACKDCKQASVCRVGELKTQMAEEFDASID